MADVSTVKKPMLYGMVTVEFMDYRNYERDLKADQMAAHLRMKLTNRADDLLIERYCELLVYTESFDFDWQGDVPVPYRAIEDWWLMVQAGKSDTDCYLFYCSNVANPVTADYVNAMSDAHRIWRPVEARPVEELTDEERADPNLPSANAE